MATNPKLKAYKPWASSNNTIDGNKANQRKGEFNLVLSR